MQGLLSAPAVRVYWISKTLRFFWSVSLGTLTCELKTVTIPNAIYMYMQTFNTHLICVIMYVCVCVLRGLCCRSSWFCKCSRLYCLTLSWKMPFHYPWNSIHLWLINKMLEISLSSPRPLHSSGKFLAVFEIINSYTVILSVGVWHCHNAKYLLEKWEGRLGSCLFPTTLCPSSKLAWAKLFNVPYAAQGLDARGTLNSSCQPVLLFASRSGSNLSYRGEGSASSSSCSLHLGEGKEMLSDTKNPFCSLSSLQIPSESELAVFSLNSSLPGLEITFRRPYKEYNSTCK